MSYALVNGIHKALVLRLRPFLAWLADSVSAGEGDNLRRLRRAAARELKGENGSFSDVRDRCGGLTVSVCLVLALTYYSRTDGLFWGSR